MKIQTRNKLNLFDLTKTSEDFFKDLLNIIYDLNLINLNAARPNTPGLDLGDEGEGIAFQITSTRTSQKLRNTLEAITDDQIQKFTEIKIFIIGDKQKDYTIPDALTQKCHFDKEKNIVDINDILRDLIVLEIDKLEEIFNLFSKEFRRIVVEFEPIDAEGNFDSSVYKIIDVIPNKPPLNANKLRELFDEDFTLLKIIELYKKLSNVPRITREIISIIGERGDNIPRGHEFGVLVQKLKNILRLSFEELYSELQILEDEQLISYTEIMNERDMESRYVVISDDVLLTIINWVQEKNSNLKKIINTMDWKIFDEEIAI